MESRKAVLILDQFCLDETAQDLVEYSLLLTFLAICSLGLLMGLKGTTSQLWSNLVVDLSAAQTAAS